MLRVPKEFLMLAMIFVLIASGCQRAPVIVKIGIVGPYEGRYRSIGYDVIYSARLAVREVNQAGGIGHYRLGLVALDDFGDPEMARQTARAMVVDPGVVAVIGHWLEETTKSASPLYEGAGLAFLPVPSKELEASDPAHLSPQFRADYAELTPFDEVAGPWAGPAYDAMQLVIASMTASWEDRGQIDRLGVSMAADKLMYSVSGSEIAWPDGGASDSK